MRELNQSELNLTEQQDFSYLLQLMMPLYQENAYALLPELFTILDYKKVIELSKYMGGETVRIPTIQELSESLESLQWFYDVYINKSKPYDSIPKEYLDNVTSIKSIYDDRNRKEDEDLS
jgi:hypothetical protein